MKKTYFVKEGYKINNNKISEAINYNRENQQEIFPYSLSIQNVERYQHDVYKLARELIIEKKLSCVLDIGCGYGTKLKDLIYPVCNDIVGVDIDHTIRYCKESYSFGTWLVDDIENPKGIGRVFDLIISSDTIEHIIDPDKLLDYIKLHSNKKTWIIISTPERDIVRGKGSMGPPENIAHVREWNRDEFHNYLVNSGFEINQHLILKNFEPHSSMGSFNNMVSCQAVVVRLPEI